MNLELFNNLSSVMNSNVRDKITDEAIKLICNEPIELVVTYHYIFNKIAEEIKRFSNDNMQEFLKGQFESQKEQSYNKPNIFGLLIQKRESKKDITYIETEENALALKTIEESNKVIDLEKERIKRITKELESYIESYTTQETFYLKGVKNG